MEMAQNDVKTYNGDFTFKNGSTLQKYDGGLKLKGTVTFGESATDVVNTAMNWAKNGFEFAGLVEGKGTVRLVGKGGNDRYLFSGANGGFTGEMMVGIKADGGVSGDTAYLDISGETALQHGIINLAGGNKAQLRLANSRVTIGGLAGTTGSQVVLKDVSAAALTISGNGTYEYAGSLASNVGLNLTGTGTQTFTGDVSNFDGTLTVNSGTLAFGGNISTTALSGAGGTLAADGTLTVNNAAANEFGGTLDLGGLTKAGEGALTLHGISFIGNTIALQGGSLEFGAGEYNLSALQSQHTEEYSAENHGYLTITDKVQLVNVESGSVSASGATFQFLTSEGLATADAVDAEGYVTLTHSDNTTYILNNGTSVDLNAEVEANFNLSTVRVQGGTGTINLTAPTFSPAGLGLDVRNGATAAITGNGQAVYLNGASSFGTGATVNIGEGAMVYLQHAGTAAAVIQHATGAGNIELGTDATLGAGTTTAATGTLTIGNGKTLTLGGGESTKVNISSFTQVVLDGGTISYNADESTINGLTVNSKKAGTLHLEDMGSKALVLGGNTVVDGTLTVKNHWNSLLTISHLTGDGTLVQTNGDNAEQEMIFAINSLQGFTGVIELSHNMNGDTTSISTGSSDVQFRALTMNIGSHTMNFALDANASIGTLTLTAGTANFTGAGTLTVDGLDGTAALNVGSLVISGTETAHSYNGTASIGSLTMNAGMQTIGGTVTPTNTWILNGGSLTLTGAYNLDSMDASSRVAGHEGGLIEGNGFESLNGIRMVSLQGGDVDASGATFSYGGVDGYTMRADGVVTVASSGTTYDTFYILQNEDSKVETLSNARTKAGEHVSEFTAIVMAGGTKLDADEGGELASLTVSGGTADATLISDSSETPATLSIGTLTVGVGDNLTLQKNTAITGTTVLDERAGLVIDTGATVSLGAVTRGLNSTVSVLGTAVLTNGDTAKSLLLADSGNGTYQLATNATLGNGVNTVANGTLVVNSGKTLALSSSKNEETHLDSLAAIRLDGGNIASSASMGTLHNVSVTADSAINFNDFKDLSGGQHQSLTTFARTTDIARGATLTVHTAYKSNQKYEGLSGAGTLKFTTNGGDYNYGGATVAIDSLQGFSGNITLVPGSNNPVNITAAIGDAPVSMGVITLANGGNITATGSNTLTVAGLDGTAGSLTVPNLTINVEGEDSHAYGGTLTVSGQLTKAGSGTQSLGTFTPAAPIVVSGGILNFTGNVEIQQLDYTEGPRYTYTDATLTAKDQANGLRYEESKRTVYTTSGDGRVTLGENVAFTLNGQTVDVVNGVYHSSSETADLTTLWVNTGTVNLADYASVERLTTAKLADAGTLNLGAAAAPGSIGTLQYQEGATVLHLAGTGTVNAITGDANLNLAEGAEITLGYNPNITSGHTFTTAGAGTLVISTLNVTGGTAHLGSNARLGRFVLSQGGENASTLEIGAGATVEVTGTVTDSDSGRGSFMVSNWPAGNVLNIEGTLIANSGISSRDGQADINVKDGGTLEMRAGLFKNTDRTQAININVKQGGKLIAAGHDGDYTSNGLHVNMEDGSTLAGYYAADVDAIAINQPLAVSGALTVDAGGTGKTMTINTGLTGEGTSITKVGEGTLVLSDASYTGATTVNAGTLKTSYLGAGGATVNGGTLDLSGATSAITTEGTLTLGNGSTLVLAGENMLTAGSLALAEGTTALTFNLNSIVPTKAGTYILATGTNSAATLEGVTVSLDWVTKPAYFTHDGVKLEGNSWVITLESEGRELTWNGGAGIWSGDAKMWHTATDVDQVFSTGDSAIFEASETLAEATLAEAVDAEKVTVQHGATVSLLAGEGEVSLTAAEMEVAGDLTTSVDVTATEIVGSGLAATWSIGEGTTVTVGTLTAEDGATLTFSGAGALIAGTITGEGTIAFDQGFPPPNVTTITVAEGKELALSGQAQKTVATENLNLAGTLVLEDDYQMTISDQFNLGTAGVDLNIRNNAHLTVSLGSAQNVLNMDGESEGHLHISSGTISYLSGLGDQTLHMGNGTKLIFGENAGEKDAPVFSNDIVMDGNMTIQVYGTNYHTLTTINGDITGTGKLTKSDGGNVDFNGTVNVGSLSVTDGCTANFNSTEAMTFQALSLAGNNTHVSFDGHVTVNGTGSDGTAGSSNDYVNVGNSGMQVEFNGGLAFHGDGGTYHYALLVGNGATATLGGTTNLEDYLIGPAAGSTLVVAENASLTAKGIYNSTGTATANGTLTVNSNATVNVSGALYEVTVNTAGNITVGGATSATTAMNVTGGTNTFIGAATIATLNANGGTATFNGTTTITNLAADGTGAVVAGSGAITVTNDGQDQGVRIAKGKDLTLTTANLTATTLFNLGTLTIGDGTTPTLVKTTYFVNGNMQDRSVPTGFEIKSGATVAISGGDNEGNTHKTGLVLSEWQNTTTATVSGNLLAKNATLLGGNDDGFTLDINNGGVVAVKGIKSRGNKTHTVNLNDGGKLVFGGTTSANNGGTLNAQAGSTIGISADTASYNGAIATTAASGKSVKIDTAKYNFNSDGTAIEQGTAGGTLNLSGTVSGDATIQKVGAGTANITGSTASFNGSVDVEVGVLNIMNAASVNVRDVTIGAGATLGVYTGTSTGGENVGSISIETDKVLTAGDGATLNANLTMKEGSVMDVSAAQTNHGLNLGCSLTIEPGATLSENDMTAISGLSMENRWYYIATSVEQLHSTDIGDWDATQGQRLTCEDYRHVDLDASEVYTDLAPQTYALVYNWGENVGTYTVAIYYVPEPTTGTLSLLALAALAARRRKHN